MWWECKKLRRPSDSFQESVWLTLPNGDDEPGEWGPNTDRECATRLFFPFIPGDVQLRNLWYMERRNRPMVPAPSNTPMPDKQPDGEGKAKLFSLYMRPWTLDPSIATEEVPHIANLDRVQRSTSCVLEAADPGAVRRRVTSKANIPSFAAAWSQYVRGNVVSQHAARLITQFMAACCGRSSKRDNDDDDGEANNDKAKEIP